MSDVDIKMRWLGAAGVEFKFDNKIFLVDPYLSRTVSKLDLAAAKIGRSIKVNQQDNPEPVEKYIEELESNRTPINAILITHTHWDHAADIPELIKRHKEKFNSTPQVFGNISCSNLLQHFNCNESFYLVSINPRLNKGYETTIYEDLESSKSVKFTPYSASHGNVENFTGSISEEEKPEYIHGSIPLLH